MAWTALLAVAAPVGVTGDVPAVHSAYTITATLDPETRTIEGHLELRWESEADQPVERVPVHLYLNAFRNTESTWLRADWHGRKMSDTDPDVLAERFEDPWGWIEMETVSQNGESCSWFYAQPDDQNPFDQTLAAVDLAEPVRPGGTLELTIDFKSRLPIPMARTGGVHEYFHAGQWFPKLGVYEPGRGWRAAQFHGATEFFADFANWDVSITVPSGYQVVATGEQVDESQADGERLVRFRQDSVHDFTFVAARDMHIETETHVPAGEGPPVEITYAVPPDSLADVDSMKHAAEVTFDVLHERVGPYPFTTMTIVEPPWRALATSGMEYPTLVTSIPGDPATRLPHAPELRVSETTVSHEIAHNYFQGILANDETEEAFLDEGFASFFEYRILQTMQSGPDWMRVLGYPFDEIQSDRFGLINDIDSVNEPVLQRPSWLYAPGTYVLQSYTRTTLIWETVERRYGSEVVDAVFRSYYRRWRFRHPHAEDFLAVVEDAAPAAADFVREAYTRPRLPDFSVDGVWVEKWEAPENLEVPEDFGEDPAGAVRVSVREPGRGAEREGRVVRLDLKKIEADDADKEEWSGEAAEEGATLFRSTARLGGPGWDHLPVTVELEFTDGVVVRDRWDGRSVWREYDVVRSAGLKRVTVDPEDEIAVDANPLNNQHREVPDRVAARNISGWLGRVFEWTFVGMSWWL